MKHNLYVTIFVLFSLISFAPKVNSDAGATSVASTSSSEMKQNSTDRNKHKVSQIKNKLFDKEGEKIWTKIINRIDEVEKKIKNGDTNTLRDNIFQILTILIASVTALFAWLSIRTSKKMSDDQLKFSKELNMQEIMLGRPIISCTGNIGILNESFFNLNIAYTNIGKRSLNNLSIEYLVLSDSPEGIIVEFKEKYSPANSVDSGANRTLYERLPRSNSKKELFFKIIFNYADALTNSNESQKFYYCFPKEQQEVLDNKIRKTVGLFEASQKNKDFINSQKI